VNTAAPPAGTTIGVPQLARPGALCFGVGDEFGDRFGRNRWMHHHDVGHDHNAGDRRDVVDEIEAKVVVKRRVNGVRRVS
jgi:hypothetical protein